MSICLSGNPDADKLLSEDPLALLIGMVLDQQIPLERAFSAPSELKQRLGGTLDAAEIANMNPESLGSIFSQRPALHRFPVSNAQRVADLCRIVINDFDGDAASIWNTAETGAELLKRIESLPGFGKQKAKIFVALLGKQLAVQPPGWETVSSPFSEPGSFYSVADITSPETLQKVRAHKASMKAAAKAAAAKS